MKLIKVGNNIDKYINANFVTSVWIEKYGEKNLYYCELLAKIRYQINREAYNKILDYGKTGI